MRVSPIEGHRLWAPSYDSELNPLLALESRTVAGLLKSRIPAVFIDVACGTGRWMLHFRNLGAEVLGLDACQEMLLEAERHPSLRGRLTLGQADSLPFSDGVADVALCSFAAAYIPDFPRVFAEMARISAPGARIVVSDMHPMAAAAGWNRSFNVGTSVYELDHVEYSAEELRTAAAAAGLRFHEQREPSFDEPERPIFERAGKTHLIPNLRTVPAIWTGMWIKP